MRPKTSPLWKASKEEMQEALDQAETYGDILYRFGLTPKGGNVRTLKQVFEHLDLDYSKMRRGPGNWVRRGGTKKLPLEDILVENSSSSRKHLKDRLLKERVLEEECAICGRLPVWEGKALVLVLDHINGISNDHRLENLRLLCPNCHSQTPTFAGKRGKYPVKVKKPRAKPEKTEYSKQRDERIRELLNDGKSYLAIGNALGISSVAVKKRAKALGLESCYHHKEGSIDVELLQQKLEDGASRRELAREMNISRPTLCRILKKLGL